MGVGVVDVRDLANIHFNAGFKSNANGRNIASGHNTNFFDMSQILKNAFPSYPLPKKAAPKWLIMLVGPMLNKNLTRKFLRANINHVWKANNSKSISELGASYRTLEETMKDSFQALVDSNTFKN